MKFQTKAPRKPLLNAKQGEIFLAHLEDDLHKKIAKSFFVDGMTNDEVAEYYSYSRRQVDRIRVSLMKTVLIRLIDKQIPKKVVKRIFDEDQIISTTYFTCPNCNENVAHLMYCAYCGQAIDWSDTDDLKR